MVQVLCLKYNLCIWEDYKKKASLLSQLSMFKSYRRTWSNVLVPLKKVSYGMMEFQHKELICG